jgi:cell division protein FtsB
MTPRATPGPRRSHVSPAVSETLLFVSLKRAPLKRAPSKRVLAKRSPFKRVSFTGRAAVLAVVVAALALALAGPLRQLISQRSQISSVQQDVARSTQQLNDLQAQEKQWSDPAYVAAQARERLHYVKPGEVPYVTLSPTPSPQATGPDAAAPDQPWYAQLWSSVQGADATPHASSSRTPAAAATPGPAVTPSASTP